IVADRHPHHAAKGLGHAETAARLEIALFQMLEFAPGLVLGMAGQMDLAISGDDRAASIDQNGGVIAPDNSGLDRQLGITKVKSDADLASEIEQRLRFRPRHLALEEAVDLRLILEIPARKERGQRELGIDDQVAAVCV